MERKYNSSLVSFAKELRKNMTPEERHLWYDFLRSYPVRFTRQKIIENYIADFYCAEHQLVIELDGSQHYEVSQTEIDAKRTEFLNSCGIRVLRFANNEVNQNFDGVCQYINMVLNGSVPAERDK